MQNWQRAAHLFSDAIERNPNHVQAYFKRGQCQSRLGNFVQAVQDFSKAMSSNLMMQMFILKEALVMPGSTGTRMRCRTISSPQSLTNLKTHVWHRVLIMLTIGGNDLLGAFRRSIGGDSTNFVKLFNEVGERFQKFCIIFGQSFLSLSSFSLQFSIRPTALVSCLLQRRFIQTSCRLSFLPNSIIS